MHPTLNVLQPQYFERFRCTGAECEDTCCEGWGILIDRQTYDKYRTLQGPHRSLVHDLVEINPASCSSSDFAKIRLAGTRCPALTDGLCSIHSTLGEPYLSDMCSSYPRVWNRVRTTTERSLHLSCPEAARLVLTDPDAMLFEESEAEEPASRPGMVSVIDDAPARHVAAARDLIIAILKQRSRPLPSRLGALSRAVEKLAGLPPEHAPAILEEQLRSEVPEERAKAMPAVQLETILELIVARIGTGYTSPRFLECYSEFMQGLQWTAESSMDELVTRYRLAARTHFEPFETRHPWVFENYLINYVFRTLFPYGRRSPDRRTVTDFSEGSVKDSFLLMVTHYAIIRTILIGMSGLHGDGLNLAHVVKLVQSCTRTFQHSSLIAADMLRFIHAQPQSLSGNITLLLAD
jgi:lysine-N-methylase